MGRRKEEGKAKGKAKRTKATPKKTVRTTQPADLAEVRKNIATLVRSAAEEIAAGVIKAAKRGQLAPAKYLFETVGLYLATEETPAKPEHSLAYTLLKRMGLPTEPVMCEEDEAPVLLGSAVNATTREPADANEVDQKRDGERNPDAAEAKE